MPDEEQGGSWLVQVEVQELEREHQREHEMVQKQELVRQQDQEQE